MRVKLRKSENGWRASARSHVREEKGVNRVGFSDAESFSWRSAVRNSIRIDGGGGGVAGFDASDPAYDSN